MREQHPSGCRCRTKKKNEYFINVATGTFRLFSVQSLDTWDFIIAKKYRCKIRRGKKAFIHTHTPTFGVVFGLFIGKIAMR